MDIDQAKSFFEILWSEAELGYLGLCSIKKGAVKTRFLDVTANGTPYNGARYCAIGSNKGWDSYHTLGLLKEPPLKGRGIESQVIAIPGLWMDIDIKTGNHAKTELPNSKQNVLDFLNEFDLKPSLIVSSGGGFHVYWLFKEPWYFENDSERKKVRALSKQFQNTLIQIGKKRFGWILDLTDDLIRLLRVPGTSNFKSDPKPVEIVEKTDFRYNPEDFEPYLIPVNLEFPKSFPDYSNKNDLNRNLTEIVENCLFLRHCHDDAAILPEPDWFCMIGALCFEGGSRPLIHDLSKPYPGYTREETEIKIRNAQDNKSGPMLCKTIQEKTGFRCPKDSCGVKSPVHLKRKTHTRTFEFGEFIPEDGNKFEKFENSQAFEEAEITKWPVLDEKALHGIAGDFVELAVRNSEADPAAVLMTFLCRFGIEVGPGPFLMVGDTKHHARVFGVIVGSSSKARKGTSGKPVKRLFDFEKFAKGNDENTLAYIPARFSPGPLSSGEGLIYAVRDKEESWKVDNKTGQGEWVTTDPGIDDKRLFILDEEFASALSCTKREGNTLSTIIRGGWDSGDIDPLTKTTKIRATGAHIGICTHITMAELNKKLNDVEAFNGFANRFLWCCAKRSKYVPFPEPMAEKDLWSIQIKLIEIFKRFKAPLEMKLSDDAKELWKKVYKNISKDHGGLVGTVINRGEAQVLRLSIIYALLDGHATIELTHLNSAIAFWEYCEVSARFIFSGRESNSFKEVIIDSLLEGPKSKTEIFRIFKNKISKEEINSTLKELIATGRIDWFEIKTNRKPKMVYKIIF